MFRAIYKKIGKMPRVDIYRYYINLNFELINQIDDLEGYFEYEEVVYLERVRFFKTNLKGHAIWLKEVQ